MNFIFFPFPAMRPNSNANPQVGVPNNYRNFPNFQGGSGGGAPGGGGGNNMTPTPNSFNGPMIPPTEDNIATTDMYPVEKQFNHALPVSVMHRLVLFQ